MRRLLLASVAIALSATVVAAESDEKLAVDPTKVITKVGLRYSDYATLSGSVAFGPVTKINVSVSENDNWSLGGSYLFKFGIVNVSASKRTLSGGIDQTQYSIGTFIPLSAFGIQPAGWQLFTGAGFNYTEGSYPIFEQEVPELGLATTASKGGYIGILTMKSLSPKWTVLAGISGSEGSNDYSGISLGGGLSYKLSDRDNLVIGASYSDNSFGTREQVSIGYSREF